MQTALFAFSTAVAAVCCAVSIDFVQHGVHVLALLACIQSAHGVCVADAHELVLTLVCTKPCTACTAAAITLNSSLSGTYVQHCSVLAHSCSQPVRFVQHVSITASQCSSKSLTMRCSCCLQPLMYTNTTASITTATAAAAPEIINRSSTVLSAMCQRWGRRHSVSKPAAAARECTSAATVRSSLAAITAVGGACGSTQCACKAKACEYLTSQVQHFTCQMVQVVHNCTSLMAAVLQQ
eukprot:6815-Heterococcus_DN1.PRE.3